MMIDVQDPRSAVIAEVLANKTAKRVLALLAEHELSQTELSQQLKLPASTVDYTMKKLVAAGLVEPARSLWSSKGRKVAVYRVSNKRIVISPKTMMRGIIPAILVSLGAAALIKLYSGSQEFTQQVAPDISSTVAGKASSVAMDGAVGAAEVVPAIDLSTYYGGLVTASHLWAWFLLGSLTVLVVLLLWNWRGK